MLKFIGGILLVTASSLAGIYKSRQLLEKIKYLELTLQVITEISSLIRYKAESLWEILNHLQSSSVYSSLEYISAMKRYDFEDFSNVWQRGILSDRQLSENEKSELITLGEVLGKTDIEGQISSLALYCERIRSIVENAKLEYSKKGRLYRSLGVLSGTMLVVLLI